MSFLNRYFILLFGVMLFAGHNVYGQLIITRVKDHNVNTTGNGFYYALPKTVLKVNIVYEKIKKIRGPFAGYTKEYLGTSDFISATTTAYKILNVDIFPEVEADPGQFYYVTITGVKSKDEKPIPAFHFTPFGTLLAIDNVKENLNRTVPQNVDQTFIIEQGNEDFKYQADYQRKKKTDTIIRKITIDTVNIEQFLFKTSWVDKTPEDRADEAAKQITAIREARFNLLTGYQEVNYGESMRYMDGQLKKLESRYLELFLGRQVKSLGSQTVYFTPDKEKTRGVLLELPDGSTVNIKIIPHELTAKLPEKPLEKPGSIYYRIPDETTVEIEYGDEIITRRIFLVNQLGIVTTVSASQTRLRFDPLTGSLIKFVKQ